MTTRSKPMNSKPHDDRAERPSDPTRRRVAALGLATMATAALPQGASAQTFPDRPLRVIVPYPPGGNGDFMARAYASKLADLIGQPVVVENKAGAGGFIGADAVAKAAPDGYTLLATPTTQLTSLPPGAKPPYDPVRDFAPVIGIATNQLVYCVPAQLEARTLNDYIERGRGKGWSYGSYGAGTSTHLLIHMMDKAARTGMAHVAYKGEAPLLTAILANEVQGGLISIQIARQQADAGRLRMLAVTGPSRSEFLPDVPHFGELGFPEVAWLVYGFAAYTQAKTPAAIRDRLEAVSRQVVAHPDVQAALRSRGNSPWGGSAADVGARMPKDIEQWNRLAAQVGKVD